jgi:hypothetical protein
VSRSSTQWERPAPAGLLILAAAFEIAEDGA